MVKDCTLNEIIHKPSNLFFFSWFPTPVNKNSHIFNAGPFVNAKYQGVEKIVQKHPEKGEMTVRGKNEPKKTKLKKLERPVLKERSQSSKISP